MSNSKLIQYTDAKSVISLQTCKHTSSFLNRIALKLSQFQMELSHLPGTMNGTTDLFSKKKKKKNTHTKTNPRTPTHVKKSIAPINRLTLSPAFKLTRQQAINLPGGPSMESAFSKHKIKPNRRQANKAVIMTAQQNHAQLIQKKTKALPLITHNHPLYKRRTPYNVTTPS